MSKRVRHVQRKRAETLWRLPWPEGDAGYGDHVYWSEDPLTPDVYARAAEALGRELDGVETGRPVDMTAWRALRRRLEADAVLNRCGDGVDVPTVPATQVYAALATDFMPGAAHDAPRIVLGPWLDGLDRQQTPHHRALLAATATAAFCRPHTLDRTPLRAWQRDGKVLPPAWLRAQVLAPARTPYAPWRLRAAGAAWHLEPLLPMQPQWVPTVPVTLEDAGWVDGGPREGGLLWARVVPTHAGWRVVAGLVLPEVPPEAWLRGVVAHVAASQLVDNRMVRFADVLRRCGHWMAGEAHAWWWVTTRRRRRRPGSG